MNAYECSALHVLAHTRALLLLLLVPPGCDPSEGAASDPPPATSLRSDSATSGVRSMSLGDGTTCAATTTGRVKCWGRNDHGQLGQGHRITLGDDEPLAAFGVVDLGGHAVDTIHTNGEQTYALLDDGTVRAWGAHSNNHLQLGGKAVQLAVGSDFACARLDDGGVRCFGANDFGQLGQGHTEPIGDGVAAAHVPTVELGARAIDLAAGAHHACAVLDGGSVRCWGLGDDGQLGLGSVASIGDDEPPSAVPAIALGKPAVAVVAGGYHTCARLETRAIRCWGRGQEGQLGLGDVETIGDDEPPVAVGEVIVGGPVVGLAAGLEHTCAVLEDGRLRCWGSGSLGRLGLGHTMTIGDDETPSVAGTVDLGTRRAVATFSGPLSTSTCIVLVGGSLRCWGENDVGQLGYGHVLTLGDDPHEGGGDLPDIVIDDDDDA